jgi:transcriptional regulator with XRE-family HTH domain
MSKYGIQNTPKEVMTLIARNIRAIRKEHKLTQQDLSTKSGVGITALKKFESTGKISLESLLKLSNALNRLQEFESILKADDLDDKNKLFDI